MKLERITGYNCPKCENRMVRDNITGHWCPKCELISDRIMLKDFHEIFIGHEMKAFNSLEERIKGELSEQDQ